VIETTKAYTTGTHRLVSPEETVDRVTKLMPIIGATRIANVTGLDTIGIPVVTVCRPNSRSISVSQGKGLTLAAAKASALMESLELHHAERPRLLLRRSSIEEMRVTDRSVDLSGLPRRTQEPLARNLALLWAEGLNLLAGDASTWVPFSLVNADWTLPVLPESHVFVASSNGLASGNHRLEAVSHAICELVERDATTLWYCGDARTRDATRLSLATVDDACCRRVLEKFNRANVRVAVWDATTDIGIPSFMCMIDDAEWSQLRPVPPFGGEGCHPAREVALLRALTEAAQLRLMFISGSRDDLGHEEYRKRLDPEYSRQKAALMAGEGTRSFSIVPTWSSPSFEDDVAWELERLRAVGITEAVVVDLTREELGVPVVRVVIPGLEGIHDIPGYVAGKRAAARLAERET